MHSGPQVQTHYRSTMVGPGSGATTAIVSRPIRRRNGAGKASLEACGSPGRKGRCRSSGPVVTPFATYLAAMAFTTVVATRLRPLWPGGVTATPGSLSGPDARQQGQDLRRSSREGLWRAAHEVAVITPQSAGTVMPGRKTIRHQASVPGCAHGISPARDDA
jgi:hypothetical protein